MAQVYPRPQLIVLRLPEVGVHGAALEGAVPRLISVQAHQRAQHSLFTLGRRQPPLPEMTSSNSRNAAGGQAGVRAGDRGGLLGTLPFLQGLGTAFRAGLRDGQADTAEAPGAGSSWLPKIAVAFYQFQCKR